MRRRFRFADLVALGIVRNRPTLQNWIRDRGFRRGRLLAPNPRTWDEAERPTAPKPIPPITPGKRRGRLPKAEPAAAVSE